MLRRSPKIAAREVRALFVAGATRDLTDGQLLERFAAGPGEASERAFAALVERHGPMVLRVSRGVLRDPNDAHDVFQATFLVLVRKARRLWVRESLGPWLHQVAYRTACRARADAARRRRHEQRSAENAGAPASRPVVANDQGRLIHAEIERLPERFRVPVVLCDLEGRSHEQAARHVGCPVGTLKSRLSRGRDRLRDRLGRLGVGPAAVGLPSAPVPPSLTLSTTSAAVRFTARGAAARGAAVTLAQGVLRAMNLTQSAKAVALIAAFGATAAGVSGQAGSGEEAPAQAPPPIAADRALDAPVVQARRGPLKVTVAAPGVLESSRVASVYSQVDGQTTIIKILPEGSRVKKGDVVCELDSAALRDRLTNQEITTRGAEADSQRAKDAQEAATAAVGEYLNGAYKIERQALDGQAETSREAIKFAQERLERQRAARKRIDGAGLLGSDPKVVDLLASADLDDRIGEAELTLARERRELALAKARIEHLEDLTKPRTLQQLNATAWQKGSDALAAKANWDLQVVKEKKLRTLIERCTIVAPADGLLVYATPSGPNAQPIGEGATVRERQKIFTLPDLNSIEFTLHVPESVIDGVAPGQPVRVKIDAFDGPVASGKVVSVQPTPDPKEFASKGRKVYYARVEITDPLPGFLPGMSGRAEVVTADRDDAITIPVGAVVRAGRRQFRVAVKTPDGFAWRDVTPGMTNDSVVEILQGLEAGETIAFDPAKLSAETGMDDATKPHPPAR